MNIVVDDYEPNVIGQCGVIYFPPVMMRWPQCDNGRFLHAVRTSARGGSAVSGQCAAAIMATWQQYGLSSPGKQDFTHGFF